MRVKAQRGGSGRPVSLPIFTAITRWRSVAKFTLRPL